MMKNIMLGEFAFELQFTPTLKQNRPFKTQLIELHKVTLFYIVFEESDYIVGGILPYFSLTLVTSTDPVFISF